MKEIISVTGLGYVGLPLAVALADHFEVIGFDIDKVRVKELYMGSDRTKEVSSDELIKPNLRFTSNPSDLSEATLHIIAVPTPIDEANRPDLSALLAASRTIGRILNPGDMVVYESTVFPGATEEECIPVLESVAAMNAGKDFFVGYSPERMNPGDREHGLSKVVKVIAAQDRESLARMALVYGKVVKAGLHEAPSIKVAEAAKILENTQRDVNIALMNEFAIICDKIGIDSHDVLAAAGTKWNFARFSPGLVGGHCIGVDPYYLIEKSERLGYNPQMLKSCRRINDGMGKYIAQKAIKATVKRGGLPLRPVAKIFGFTFKENCPDVRNTKVMDIIAELSQFGVTCIVHDPQADRDFVFEEYGISLLPWEVINSTPADMAIIAVAHREYREMTPDQIKNLTSPGGVIVDVKGILSEQVRNDFRLKVVRI